MKGGKRIALLGVVALALACGAVGCVADAGDTGDDEAVGTAQDGLTEPDQVSYAEGSVVAPGDTVEDPEPTPWVPGAVTADDAPPNPGDPIAEPEPTPWQPMHEGDGSNKKGK